MGFVTFKIGDYEFFSFKRTGNRIVAYNAHLPRCDFDHCPICYRSGKLTEEHVLLDSLGGKVLTLTCSDCNNKFGKLHEKGLARARLGLRDGRIRVDGLPGERTATIQTMFNRDTGQMEEDRLESYDKDARGKIKTRDDWSIASIGEFVGEDSVKASLLKAAYLSHCVRFGEIPGEEADDIRSELIEARDVKDADDYTPGPITSSLKYLWGYSYSPNTEHRINFDAAVVTDSGDAWEGVLLGGVAVVQHVLERPKECGLTPLSLDAWRDLASRAERQDSGSP